jgi:hypothetical protein
MTTEYQSFGAIADFAIANEKSDERNESHLGYVRESRRIRENRNCTTVGHMRMDNKREVLRGKQSQQSQQGRSRKCIAQVVLSISLNTFVTASEYFSVDLIKLVWHMMST